MTRKRWFLPDVPDVLGLLRQQTDITVEGLDALIAWAENDPAAEKRLREREHAADDTKRELRRALTVALTTPLDAEDLFELSRELDEVLNAAKDTVREAELIATGPDAAMAGMARELAAGARELAKAFEALAQRRSEDATESADAAVKCQRRLERVYRSAMSDLLEIDDLRMVTARRELYRRLSRASDALIRVAERVWYAVLKES